MDRNPVVHFEMPYESAKRLSAFYSGVFGWDMRDTGKDMGDYITAATAETDEQRMVKTPGTINGGFYPKSSGAPTEPSVVISVPDLKATMKRISDAGGTLLGEPMDIPGIGKYISMKDTEGNRVGVLQPTMP